MVCSSSKLCAWEVRATNFTNLFLMSELIGLASMLTFLLWHAYNNIKYVFGLHRLQCLWKTERKLMFFFAFRCRTLNMTFSFSIAYKVSQITIDLFALTKRKIMILI